MPDVAGECLAALGAQLQMLKARLLQFDRLIMVWHRSNEVSKRLDDIPGVGPALATALVASVANPKAFRSGRDFSAWIGLVPDPAGTSQHGSALCRGSTPAEARTGSAVSASRGIAITKLVHGRSSGRHSLRQDPRHQTPAMAHGLVGAAPDKGRRHRTCEQNCADGLGYDGQGRAL